MKKNAKKKWEKPKIEGIKKRNLVATQCWKDDFSCIPDQVPPAYRWREVMNS